MKDTSKLVIAYVIIYMIAIILYCSPRIIAEYTSINVSHINENFSFPLEIFAWGLLAVCSGYSGLDLGIKKTHKIKLNSNKSKVRNVIVLLALVLLESMLFNYFLGHEFTVFTEFGKQVFKGINLPLDGISTALVTTMVIYISGQQLLK